MLLGFVFVKELKHSSQSRMGQGVVRGNLQDVFELSDCLRIASLPLVEGSQFVEAVPVLRPKRRRRLIDLLRIVVLSHAGEYGGFRQQGVWGRGVPGPRLVGFHRAPGCTAPFRCECAPA